VPPSESASERSRRPRAGRRNRSSIAGAGPRSAGRRVRPRTSPARRVRDRRARERTATGAVRTVIRESSQIGQIRARETDRQVGSGRREAILTGRDSCFERRFHGVGFTSEKSTFGCRNESGEGGMHAGGRRPGRGSRSRTRRNRRSGGPPASQRPSIEVTLDGRCEWSSGFRREWMEKSAPLSWQHGIATPSPADCCSRAHGRAVRPLRLTHGCRRRVLACETSGPALFAFEALLPSSRGVAARMVWRDQRSRSRASPPARATARRLTGLERYAASLYRAPLANHRVESVPSDPLADRNDLAASTGLVLIDDCLLERIVGRTRVVAGTY